MTVPYSERVAYKLNGIPLGMRTALYRRSREEDTSYANLIGSALAARYELEYEATTRGRANGPPGETLPLRLPAAVMDAIYADGDERGITFRSVILEALAEALGLQVPEATEVNPARRPGAPPTPNGYRRPKHGRPRGRKGKS